MKRIPLLISFLFHIFANETIGHISAQKQNILPKDSLSARQWYLVADSLYQLRQYKDCIEPLENAINAYAPEEMKGKVRATIKLGLVYDRMSNLQKALEYFDVAEQNARTIAELENDPKLLISALTQRGYVLRDLRQGKESIAVLNEAKNLILGDSLNYYQLSYIEGSLGKHKLTSGDIEGAFAILTRSLDYARKSGSQPAIHASLNSCARYYWQIGNYQESKRLLNEIIESIPVEKRNSTRMYHSVINNLGILEMNTNEYDKAITIFKRSAELAREKPEMGIGNLMGSLSSLATSYNILGESELCIEAATEAIDLAKKHGIPDYRIFNHLKFRHSSNLRLGNIELAGNDLSSMERISDSGLLSLVETADFYKKKSFFLREIGKFDEAKIWILKAVETLEKQYVRKGRYLTDVYNEVAGLAYKNGDLAEALKWEQKAFINNLKTGEKPNEDYSNVIYGEGLINALVLRGDILNKMAITTDSTELFDMVLEPYDEALDYINYNRTKISDELFGARFMVNFHRNAVDYSFDAYERSQHPKWLSKAVTLSNLGRSDLLYAWLKEAEEFKSANLSDSLYDYKKSLQLAISTFEGFKSTEESKNEKDTVKLQFLTDTLFQLRQKRLELVDQLKQSNPSFYEIMFADNQGNSLAELSQMANENDETIVVYNLALTNVYAIVINENPTWVKLGKVDKLDVLPNFRNCLTDANIDSLEHYAAAFYNLLIDPIAQHLKGSKLNIIADGELNYIPFEVLIDSTGKFLFEEFEITYSYSTQLLDSKKRGSNSDKMLAFAPEFVSDNFLAAADPVRGELSKLPGAFDEVKAIQSIFNGNEFISADATETNFKNYAPNSGLIHLATHAIIDDENPDQSRLIFNLGKDTINDGYLHSREIYNLDLNAQLVTLSACNTGFGKIKKGEGVMSLSRAFAYAGVPSTVVSLWPASDKSTPELMKFFYEYLSDGQAKDVALNNARKSYLANATGKARHPFYWGGFVLIGDNSPIESDKGIANSLLFMGIGLVCMLLVFVIRGKRGRLPKKEITWDDGDEKISL